MSARMAAKSKLGLVGGAYERLKDDIRSNRLPPGFQAPEPEIAERLGMSRTPVREALIRLEAEGLVELIPRRGARVMPITREDMREIYDILTALEPEAAAQLAERHPDAATLQPLVDATADMETALAAEDLDAWADADDRFHRKLLDLQGNKRLQGFVEELFDQAHRARIVTLRLRALPVQSTRDHRDVLEALAAGDAGQARNIFRLHRQRAATELLGLLNDYKLPGL